MHVFVTRLHTCLCMYVGVLILCPQRCMYTYAMYATTEVCMCCVCLHYITIKCVLFSLILNDPELVEKHYIVVCSKIVVNFSKIEYLLK